MPEPPGKPNAYTRIYVSAHSLRMVVLMVLRGTAVVLILMGLAGVGRDAAMALGGVSVTEFLWGLLFTTMGFLAPGLVLAFGGRSIARWLVPAPRVGCLHCGYDARGAGLTRCPECGESMPG